MQFGNEKRRYPRKNLNRLVKVASHSGESKQVVGVNYSQGGMALNCQVPLPEGEFVYLEFRTNEAEQQGFSIAAEVMQNIKHGSMYLTGVKFVGTLESARDSNVELMA